ncbi:hypothetical protein CVT24_010131 [Panaeolus cyanescens]|uniref:Uncharacterized protein n=1 Tax=Panaeolus cyanescens TaxID=181874 RepID=A0A409W9M5_9AGAR|nr:hypothetical protein CVT24_010131 [Panaeolus cyanescens]
MVNPNHSHSRSTRYMNIDEFNPTNGVNCQTRQNGVPLARNTASTYSHSATSSNSSFSPSTVVPIQPKLPSQTQPPSHLTDEKFKSLMSQLNCIVKPPDISQADPRPDNRPHPYSTTRPPAPPAPTHVANPHNLAHQHPSPRPGELPESQYYYSQHNIKHHGDVPSFDDMYSAHTGMWTSEHPRFTEIKWYKYLYGQEYDAAFEDFLREGAYGGDGSGVGVGWDRWLEECQTGQSMVIDEERNSNVA